MHDLDSVSVSPTRLLSRSATLSTSHSSRPPVRVSANFEPRVVHATPDISRSVDNTCAPSHSPTQTRRASGANGRSISVQRQNPTAPPLPNTSPVLFPRPAYLEHSALRDLLVTETPSTLTGSAPQRKKTSPPPARNIHAYATSPSTDSDEDSISSPPPPVRDVRAVSTVVVPEGQITYPLPTRWSDQARSNTLSISHDGRELSHHGASSGV
jgi:hypothetical protein